MLSELIPSEFIVCMCYSGVIHNGECSSGFIPCIERVSWY